MAEDHAVPLPTLCSVRCTGLGSMPVVLVPLPPKGSPPWAGPQSASGASGWAQHQQQQQPLRQEAASSGGAVALCDRVSLLCPVRATGVFSPQHLALLDVSKAVPLLLPAHDTSAAEAAAAAHKAAAQLCLQLPPPQQQQLAERGWEQAQQPQQQGQQGQQPPPQLFLLCATTSGRLRMAALDAPHPTQLRSMRLALQPQRLALHAGSGLLAVAGAVLQGVSYPAPSIPEKWVLV